MKQRIKFLIAILACIFVMTACSNLKQTKQDAMVQTSEVIFSFESYEDITGTGIYFNNSFGQTAINTDKAYITDGEGSWLVKPQGNYGKANVYPQFRMRCIETTFETNDFSKYEKVTLDIYNASDEEMSIEWNFSVLDTTESYVGTDKNIYVLQPGAWTTCEYDLSGQAYSSYFRLNMVKYMTVTILDKKEAKDDKVNELYFDNLRGHFSEEERILSAMEYNFYEGVTFENTTDHYLFSPTGHYQSNVEWKRVNYADTGLENVDESLGEYCLSGDATGIVWPSAMINFVEKLEEDTILRFMCYAEMDPELCGEQTYFFEAFRTIEERGNPKIFTKSSKFNEWTEVQILLEKGTVVPRIVVNFDDNTGNNKFGEAPITIYMDNFILEEAKEEVIVAKNGDLTLKNPYNRSMLEYKVDKPIKKGDIITFDIDFNTEEPLAVWVLGDGYWEEEWYAYGYDVWDGKKHIQVEAQDDADHFYIYVQYRGSSSQYTEHVCEIKNIKITDEIQLYNYSGAEQVMYTFKKPVKKGQHISFDIDIIPKQKVAIWVLGDDMWEDEYYAKEFENWTGKRTISANVKSDTQQFTVYVKYFDNAKDWSDNVVTISDLKIGNGYVKTDSSANGSIVTVKKDGTVIIENPTGTDYVTYRFDKSVKAGKSIQFDINVTPSQSVSVWVLGDGMWEEEYYAKAYETWPGKHTIAAEVTSDSENFTVFVKFNDTKKDFSKNVVTIKNLKVKTGDIQVSKDGTVSIKNSNGANRVSYTFPKAVKAGQEVSFDLEVSPSQLVAVWLLDDTDKEYIAKEFIAWDGTKRLSATLSDDTTTFDIMVEFRDTTKDFSKNVVTISNVAIGTPKETVTDVTVDKDGTVTIKNSEGSQRVSYTFDKEVKAGQEVTFDLEVSPSQVVAVWLMDMTDKEYIAKEYAPWTGTKQLSAVLSKDTKTFKVLVEFRDMSKDFTKNVVTISNVAIGEPKEEDITVGEDGTVTIKNSEGNKRVSYTFATEVPAGHVVNFDMEISPSQLNAIWLLDDTDKEYIASEFAAWDGKKTFSTKLSKATKEFDIIVEFRDTTKDFSKNVVTISNVQITDGSVTIDNASGVSDVTYNVIGPYKAGSKLTFEIDFNTTDALAIWVLGNGSWNNEWFVRGYDAWTGKQTIEVELKSDINYAQIYIQYRDADGVYTGNTATISNIEVSE